MTLLTVDDIRASVPTALEDEALQLLLDVAEAEIDRAAGPLGATLELVGGGGRLITLGRQAASITSVTETIYRTVRTLSADDYLLYPGGYILERLSTGTLPRWRWWGRVAVTYTPLDDEIIREGVQLDLVKLALDYQPGLTLERIGEWEQRFAVTPERQAILDRLQPDPMMIVVGG